MIRSGSWRKWLPGRSSELRSELLKGGVGVGGLKILSLLLNLALSVLLARMLGPEGYGQYAFILALVMVLSIPINQGLGQLITREVARFNHGAHWGLMRGLFRWSQWWVVLGCLLLWAGLLPLALFRAAWQFSDTWTLFSLALLMLPFLGLNTVRASALRGLGHVVAAQIPDLFVRPGFQLALLGALLLLGTLNPLTALLAAVVAAGLAFLVGTKLLAIRMPGAARVAKPDYRIRAWARSWLPLTLLTAGTLLNNQVGILLLGWLGSDEQVGALRVADHGAQMVAASLIIVNLVIAPHFVHAYQDGNRDRMQKLSRQSARAALLCASIVAVPFLFLGGPVIAAVVGDDYVSLAVGPLAILTGAQLVNVAFGSVGLFLIMSGFERDTLIGQLLGLVVNTVLALIFIPRLGADGAAYAAAAGLVCWNGVLAVMVYKRLGLRPGAV